MGFLGMQQASGPGRWGSAGPARPFQFMQKKSPLYMLLKEDTVWSMDHLNHYINSKFSKTPGLPRDWVLTTFTVRLHTQGPVCVCAYGPAWSMCVTGRAVSTFGTSLV